MLVTCGRDQYAIRVKVRGFGVISPAIVITNGTEKM